MRGGSDKRVILCVDFFSCSEILNTVVDENFIKCIDCSHTLYQYGMLSSPEFYGATHGYKQTCIRDNTMVTPSSRIVPYIVGVNVICFVVVLNGTDEITFVGRYVFMK